MSLGIEVGIVADLLVHDPEGAASGQRAEQLVPCGGAESGRGEIVSKLDSDVVEKKIEFHIFDMAHFDF